MTAPTIRLIFGVHSHQPIGNLDEVFRKALSTAYDPFLDVLERHPGVRIALHYSGCLYEWLEAHAPGHLDRIGRLARAGRLELLGGAFYEPILPLIPPGDRVGQIRLQSRYMKDRFGAAPRGIWLAERVWDPALPETLERAGVEFTLLDDAHFLGAMDDDPVGGYYATEHLGSSVLLFPISEKLRYLIPFREPEETIDHLRAMASQAAAEGKPEPVAAIVDDGEKFGLWPETAAWVYGTAGKAGWLERFFTLLEENVSWLRCATFGEALDTQPPRGRVFLPPGSYFEMGEWVLPVSRGRQFAALVAGSRQRGAWEAERPFLRGGYFAGFLSKYDETWLTARRAQALSGRLDTHSPDEAAAARDGSPGSARRDLWRAMCNCGWWHGIFGGLYLPHIRRAVGEHLCRAEKQLDHSGAAAAPDRSMISIVSGDLALLVEPSRGGAIRSLDLRARDFPLGSTLTRRYEIYHQDVLRAGAADAGGSGHESIHDRAVSATDEMRALVVADDRTRASAVDRFFGAGVTVQDLVSARPVDLGDFAGGAYTAALLDDDDGAGVRLARQGWIGGQARPGGARIDLRKVVRAAGSRGALEIAWDLSWLQSPPPRGVRFACELNLALIEKTGRIVMGGDARSSAARALSDAWEAPPVQELRVEEDHARFALEIRIAPAAAIWHYPVRTVSRSEEGFEANYQGSALLFVWGGTPDDGEQVPGACRLVMDVTLRD